MAESQTKFTLLPKVLNGGIAGVAGISCTFPLDLVKTRLQKQTIGKDGSRMYDSIFDAFRKVYKAEGLRGMYRGSGILIFLVTPEKAVKLAANDFFRFHLKNQKSNELSAFRQALAGIFTGLAQLVITVPMELLKIQLQDAGRIALVEASAGPKMSASRLAADLIKSRGIFGLYKGTTVTMLRDVPFCVVYFSLFAKLDAYGPRKTDGSGSAKFYWSFLSGLASGSISALIVTPLDVMKTRIQTVAKSAKGDKSYSSVYTAFFVLSPTRQALAGALTGVVQLVVTVPMELLKIQLQDAGRVAAMEAILTGKRQVSQISATKVATNLIRSRGPLGLYKGLIPTMCRDVPFCSMYFPIFAQLDSYGPRKTDGSGNAKFYWSFACALITASFSALMMTPCDVMKTRIQNVTKAAKGDKTYSGVFDAFKDILKTEGPLAFYKGGACRVLVIAPTYAIIQAIYFLGVAEKLLGIEKDVKIIKK